MFFLFFHFSIFIFCFFAVFFIFPFFSCFFIFSIFSLFFHSHPKKNITFSFTNLNFKARFWVREEEKRRKKKEERRKNKECQCYTCTETPTQQSATTQDQHHAQGLALCHDVTLDIVTHRWVPAGHPQYTGAREGRLWVAQAQTQLTLFVDPQSLSLECEHGSGAEGSKCSQDQGPSPNAGQ